MVLGGSSDVYRTQGYYGHSSRKDGRRVILVIASDEKKKKEIRELLGDKYGCNVIFRATADMPECLHSPMCPADVQSEKAIAAVHDIAAKWDVENTSSPQFVLREDGCILSDLRRHVTLDPAEVIANPEKFANTLLQDRNFLAVWKLNWDKESGKLIDIGARWFEHTAQGYIDPARKGQATADTFGWDNLYVVPQLGRSYEELRRMGPCGKIASRQMTLSAFTMQYLLYEKPKGLGHNKELATGVFKRAVQFDKDTSVAAFMRNNQYLNNPHRKWWGLDRFTAAVLNDGVFFRSAASRPMSNYFSPPVGGIPLTLKKDAVEETVFMSHDLGHQNIPDLIYCGEDLSTLAESDRRSFVNVYSIWRMLSEATTMMLADCLYAHTLAQTSADYVPCLDKRIYPLWCRVQKRLTENGTASRMTCIRRLMWANASFALLGITSEWEKYLDIDGCKEDKEALDNFVNHFTKFFVGDTCWTKTNLDCMTQNCAAYKTWHDEIVTGKRFETAGLPRVSDVVLALRQRGVDCSANYDVELVRHVWEYLIDTRIEPILGGNDEEPIKELSDEQRISKGFYRYLVGQLYFYARFSAVLPVLVEKGRALVAAMDRESGGGDPAAFSAEAISRLTAQYHADVRFVWGMGCISSASAEEYCQVHPVFEPSYVSYASIMEQFGSIPIVVDAMFPKKK